MTPFFTVLWTCLPVLLICSVAPYAAAQQTKPYGNPVFLDKTEHLFAPYMSNTTSFIDEEGRIMAHADSAKLHGNMTAYNMLQAQYNVLVCIDNTLLSHSENDTVSQEGFAEAASGCDGAVTDALVSHSIGNNATINHLATMYLNVRGIK
jgi:hypothetical protein